MTNVRKWLGQRFVWTAVATMVCLLPVAGAWGEDAKPSAKQGSGAKGQHSHHQAHHHYGAKKGKSGGHGGHRFGSVPSTPKSGGK